MKTPRPAARQRAYDDVRESSAGDRETTDAPSADHVKHAGDLALDLAAMDARAQAQGHSLASVLEWAAGAAFGISLTTPPAPETDEG